MIKHSELSSIFNSRSENYLILYILRSSFSKKKKKRMCVDCNPINPISFTPTLKFYILQFIIFQKISLTLKPNSKLFHFVLSFNPPNKEMHGIMSSMTIDRLFKTFNIDLPKNTQIMMHK
jgi:hypothetical protein